MKRDMFIKKAKEVHGDKYDYSLVIDNVDYKSKIIIKCKNHNSEFEQTPNNHLRGKGCKLCAIDNRKNKLKMSKDDFIKKAKEFHGDKYDYSKVEYINYHTNICIICKKHGEFFQKPSKHISRGFGCKKCGMLNKPQCQPMNNEYFIKKAKEVHGDKYDYSLVNYIKTHENVKIVCPDHGDFEQLPSNHLRFNRGCPKCNANFSNIEKDFLEFIKENYGGVVFANVKDVIGPYELDVYLPDLKLAFEFNGLYWHSENFVHKNYHLDKTLKCELNHNIHLIHIYEDDWIYKQKIVKSRILNLLCKSKKIYARKCLLKDVSYKETKEFLERNHLQGNCISKIRLGLYYNDELVSLMSFGKLRRCLGQKNKENQYELLRFCNKLNTTVVGGANKIFSKFINTYVYDLVISYADRSWTMNNGNTLYNKLGFGFVSLCDPNYYYVNKGIKENRFKYRKDVLVKQGFDINKSEHEIMLERSLYRIYNSGNIKYEFKNKNKID